MSAESSESLTRAKSYSYFPLAVTRNLNWMAAAAAAGHWHVSRSRSHSGLLVNLSNSFQVSKSTQFKQLQLHVSSCKEVAPVRRPRRVTFRSRFGGAQSMP